MSEASKRARELYVSEDGWVRIDSDHLATLCDELAEAEEENNTLGTQAYNMEERIFQAEAREVDLHEALKNLAYDSMASDFNEHWDSYLAAERLIEIGKALTKGLPTAEDKP